MARLGWNGLNPLGDLQSGFAAQAQQLDLWIRQKRAQLDATRRAIDAGLAAPKGPPPVRRQVPVTSTKTPPPERPVKGPGRIRDEARAAISGFADNALLGLADPGSALFDAALGRGGGGTLLERFNNNLAAEHAQDAFDRANYGGARFGGQAAGTFAGMAATGGALGGLNAVRAGIGTVSAGRLVPQVGNVLRLAGVSGVAGGVGNAAVEAALSKASNLAFTRGDLAGSLAGGAIGGLAAPFLGPVRGAALSGISTPLLQSLFNAQAPSPVEVAVGGTVGGISGVVSRAAISRALAKMTTGQKGEIGERLGRSDSRLLGHRVLGTQKWQTVSGGRTKLDHFTDSTFDESKFGRTTLKPRQRESLRELENYVVRHYRPEDLYNANALLMTGIAAPTVPIPVEFRLSAGHSR